MAHNIDNRTQRERRQRRAYMKSLRRLDAFDKTGGKKDSPERFQIWLKGWRAKHPADARTPEQLTRVYKEEISPAETPSAEAAQGEEGQGTGRAQSSGTTQGREKRKIRQEGR